MREKKQKQMIMQVNKNNRKNRWRKDREEIEGSSDNGRTVEL